MPGTLLSTAKKNGTISSQRQLADQGRQTHKELHAIQCDKCIPSRLSMKDAGGEEGAQGGLDCQSTI